MLEQTNPYNTHEPSGEYDMLFQDLTGKIIGCCIEVHRELGPGFLEGIYESALAIELFQQGVKFQRQVPLPITYKGKDIGEYRMDLLVENTAVVELKSTERLDPVFDAQVLSYMKMGGYRVGLLINFNSVMLTKGVKRFIL